MSPSLLLMHSPLVGPSSLQRIAGCASKLGFKVVLPDLTPTAGIGYTPDEYARRAIEATDGLASPIVVGHSGAGAFLPLIGAALDGLGALVFVDAVVPPTSDAFRTPDRMKQMLDQNTDDMTLRRWLDWWPESDVAELLPDPEDRRLLAEDMPRLPRDFYETEVAVPAGWSTQACAYVRLSGAYDGELAKAVARRWPTATTDGTHLSIHTDPAQVFDAIVDVVDRLG